MGERLPIWTIGHSTLTVEAFVARLQAAEVTRVVDVRSITRSRTNPQFNQSTLPESLAPYGIEYTHLPLLGGRRGRQRGIAPEVNGYWELASFHNYADYALLPAFAEGLAQLQALARPQRAAIMCAEAVWWRCHRRIVADHLIAKGEPVRHIMPSHIDDAELNPAARISDSGELTYPAPEAPEAES